MSLEHAILGFLKFRSLSGYDLKKVFEQSVGHFWSATQSHIYKALDTLHTDGLVEATEIVQSDRPNRKEYSITPAGIKELDDWLATPHGLAPIRSEWLIQVFFAQDLSNEQIVHLFTERARAIQAEIDTYRTKTSETLNQYRQLIKIERAGQLWALTLDYGIANMEAELHWLESKIDQLRRLPPMPHTTQFQQ
jgi:PadR family transcriptional regulator AphA